VGGTARCGDQRVDVLDLATDVVVRGVVAGASAESAGVSSVTRDDEAEDRRTRIWGARSPLTDLCQIAGYVR
jgi:hypothetical protein